MAGHIKQTRGSRFRLARTKQCEKCPWKVSTDPMTIPGGYTARRHAGLRSTIASPGVLIPSLRVMACHEHPPGREVYCLGWLMNQLGSGNNILLRICMRECENIGDVMLDGEQHPDFDATLP